jgi:hypothetical protein
MIKFFRKIRQKMLSENRFITYLIYAIGEIVLVVIGILIALQINNWNENRKLRTQEISHLKNIQEDKLLDTTDIKFNIRYHLLFVKSEKKLLNYMFSKELKPNEPIDFEFAFGIPIILTLHESSYANLRDMGANIITNGRLKKQISNHFDFVEKSILRIENEEKEYKTYSLKKPYFLKYFNYGNSSSFIENANYNNSDFFAPDIKFNKLILVDTLGLKNDEEFKIVLAQSILFTDLKIQMYEDLLKRIVDLDASINEELKKIEN